MRIEEIDKNMKIESEVAPEDTVWFDVRKAPFDIYGLYEPKTQAEFLRMPQDFADTVSLGVSHLNKNTAGGRVRFVTSSPYVALKAEMDNTPLMNHIARSGQSGFDLYMKDDSGKYNFHGSFRPKTDVEDGFEAVCFTENKSEACFEINFPTYDNVKNLYLGFKKGSILLEGEKYSHPVPVLFYGSSITQGGCASRPGNAYISIISRDLDTDIINLGFSGNCKAEQNMAEYLSQIKMSVFVCDYDHNAPTPEYLESTHLPLYKTFRTYQKDTPIVFVTKPDWVFNKEVSIKRREIVRKTYEYALSVSDKNVYFIDGETLWAGENAYDCTVDGCHPNDLGFYRMAKVIGGVLKNLI